MEGQIRTSEVKSHWHYRKNLSNYLKLLYTSCTSYQNIKIIIFFEIFKILTKSTSRKRSYCTHHITHVPFASGYIFVIVIITVTISTSSLILVLYYFIFVGSFAFLTFSIFIIIIHLSFVYSYHCNYLLSYYYRTFINFDLLIHLNETMLQILNTNHTAHYEKGYC